MDLKKCTDASETAVWINADHVEHINPADDGYINVYLASGFVVTIREPGNPFTDPPPPKRGTYGTGDVKR